MQSPAFVVLSLVALLAAIVDGRLRDMDNPTDAHSPSVNTTGKVLQKNVQYASGSIPAGDCLPVEYYFTDKDNKLWRKDQGKDKLVKIADNTRSAFTAWDDSVWSVDQEGTPSRFHFNGSLEKVPNSDKKFLTIAPVSFVEAYAISTDGDPYRYVAGKWILLDAGSDKKTLSSIGVGMDGSVIAGSRKNIKIFAFDHGTQKFKPYEINGFGGDIYDADHVIVVKDKDFNVKAKSGGKWTELKEKCQRTSAFSADQFYCTNPNGDVLLVHYP
ncbi:uncharacterized protein LOC129599294 [Paramacrobiotus metropolitanus]|uniref:uncharacterized protein LOC129599294 n=1 Tax=Paramacrobiotus metropolitanus TaxID=2943436 RepID=UPI002445A0DE|nr:uncharacterized protein LOC129599294 [Paramacrobiotus metropolitanus]